MFERQSELIVLHNAVYVSILLSPDTCLYKIKANCKKGSLNIVMVANGKSINTNRSYLLLVVDHFAYKTYIVVWGAMSVGGIHVA